MLVRKYKFWLTHLHNDRPNMAM